MTIVLTRITLDARTVFIDGPNGTITYGTEFTNPFGITAAIFGRNDSGGTIIIPDSQFGTGPGQYNINKLTLRNFGLYGPSKSNIAQNDLAGLAAANDIPISLYDTYLFNRGYLYMYTVYDDGGGGCCCTKTYTFSKLRLNQRNDGKGIFAHPRLKESVGTSTAKSDPNSQRVGDNNRLDGAVHVEG